MGHGLPDFYRGVDIAYQALSELINRPKYGAAQKSFASVWVTPGVITNLISVSGKGIIYGGVLYLSPSTNQEGSSPRLTVDGIFLAGLSFYTLNRYGWNIPQSYVWYLTKYDNVNFVFSVGIGYPITFESSFVVGYKENYEVSVNVACDFCYALV
mgnify:CR=1 FL=1